MNSNANVPSAPEADPGKASAGSGLERYRLMGRLGAGSAAAVYQAIDGESQQRVALKIFDRSKVEGAPLLRSLQSDYEVVSAISHPRILPVHEVGMSGAGYVYMAMALVSERTLQHRLEEGPIDPPRACDVLDEIAQALHAAHERGILHHDVKPGNVLFDDEGQPFLSDFGTARTSYGFLGTPGYIAPEQVLGIPVDRRRDVFALGVVAFEMLVGAPPFDRTSAIESILATVQEPPLVASQVNPGLASGLDVVLARVLAKVPEDRYPTTIDFTRELRDHMRGAVVVNGLSAAAPRPATTPRTASNRGLEASFASSVAKLQEVLDLALSPSVMVDEKSFVTGWNDLAERTFGWSREEILGRSLLTTLIPPRYREAHERGFQRYLETGQGAALGKKLELSALHKDGFEIPIELSISEAVRTGGQARVLGFVRDISQELLQRRLSAIQATVTRIIEEAGSLQAAAPRMLEAIGRELGWSASALWLLDGDGDSLRCVQFWEAEPTEARFREACLASRFEKGEGLPGKAWAREEPVWLEEFVSGEDGARVLAAVRAGLRTAMAAPILHGGGVRGVIELFTSERRREDAITLTALYNFGRKIGAAGRGDRPSPPSVAKLQEILDLALTPSIMLDEMSLVTGWNDRAEQTFGWTREEIVGRSLVTTLIPPRYREGHERGFQKYLETGQGAALGKKLELSALHKDGFEIPIELSISEAVRSGGRLRVLGFVRDISQERVQRRLRAAQASVTRIIEEAEGLQAAAPGMLEAIGREVGWSASALWLLDGDGASLRCLECWEAEPTPARFREACLASRFEKGEGLPGKVWAREESVWLEEFVSGEDGARVLAAVRAGLRTAAAAPIFHAGEVRGVIELLASERMREDTSLLTGLSDLGRKVGPLIQR